MSEAMKSAVDLSNCANEPIHLPGSIQPHGALVAFREPDLEIVVASRNAGEVFGVEQPILGNAMATLLDAASFERVTSALGGDPRAQNPIPLRLLDGTEAHGILHRSNGLLILETEPVGLDETIFRTAYRSLIGRFDRLRLATDLVSLFDIAVEEVSALTEFDRIMIYRFDERNNGQVIAEKVNNENLEPYLGLHYPASDIPAQARRLYVENPIRIIPDASYTSVPLEPAVLPESGRPLDLSHATLRSVSPIHCRYLVNMGVQSSMSISLLDGKDLWGLVACHHSVSRHVPYGVRLVLEFFSRLLASRIIELERVERIVHVNEAYGIQNELIDQMVSASSFQDGLKGKGRKLTDLIECDGAAILYRDAVTRIGTELGEEKIRRLGAVVHDVAPGKVFHSDRIAQDLGEQLGSQPWGEASGVVAVPISADGMDLLFWFRSEWVRSVRWGGNPHKAAGLDENQQLTPRASFAEWIEEVRDCSRPWAAWEVKIASDFRTALVASVIHQAAELERLNASLMSANEEKDFFLAAVSHELRNPLNAIVGWVEVLLRDPDPDRKRLDRALQIIKSNAREQSELIEDLLDVSRISAGNFRMEVELVQISSVVEEAIESVRPSAEAQSIPIVVQLIQSDPPMLGDPHRLRQVVWNLLSNAIKFSAAGQAIEVSLRQAESLLELKVQDQGCGIEPEVLDQIFNPFSQGETSQRRSGLGLGLSIVKSIVELHKGTVTATSEGAGKGACFSVRLPVATLRASEISLPESRSNLEGLLLLVVDDQEDAAAMLKILLEGHGAQVETAGDGAQALSWLQQGHPVDLVLSDLDLPEMDGFELLRAVRADAALAEIPIVTLTAFGQRSDRTKAIKAGFRQHVTKPVEPDELVAVIESVLGRL